ncbi:MAG: hypothetical protein GWN29_12465 [Gammaproteobacteria bacterium]|nr:hypothetical protein [Gammaproteobacteria bacterium]
MSTRLAFFLVAFSLPILTSAQDGQNHRCTNGDVVRRVEILYTTGAAVPCAVHYYKDTEAPGALEVPWNAQKQTGYCEARAGELVASLRGWGWTCSATGASGTVRDDTDALSAGEAP